MTDEIARMSDHFFHVPGDAQRDLRGDSKCQFTRLGIARYDSPLIAQLAACALPDPVRRMGAALHFGIAGDELLLVQRPGGAGDAQQHYLEELIRLPGIGICYYKPIIPSGLIAACARRVWTARRPHGVPVLPIYLQVPSETRRSVCGNC